MTLTNPYEVDSNTLGDQWLLECTTDSKDLALLSSSFLAIQCCMISTIQTPRPLRASSLRGVPKALDPIHRIN